mgnify:CR=1 FL=1
MEQASYRLIVANAASQQIVWDSKVVASNSSVNVEYAGSTLGSGESYTVNVTAVARSLMAAPLAATTATFSMGLLTADEWHGSWIGMASAARSAAPWFRTPFALAAADASSEALLYVASVGYHEATINGKPASATSVLAPSVSYLPKRVLYRTYNVSGLLVAGDNVLGLWAAYLCGSCCVLGSEESGASAWGVALKLLMSAVVVGGGVVAATALCVITFQWKRRKSRFRMRLGELREGGSQYEMEDTQQYDDFAETGGAYGATGSDSAQLLAEQAHDGGQEDVI